MGIFYDVSVRAIKQQIYRIFNDREFQKEAALFYLGHLMELTFHGEKSDTMHVFVLPLCYNKTGTVI